METRVSLKYFVNDCRTPLLNRRAFFCTTCCYYNTSKFWGDSNGYTFQHGKICDDMITLTTIFEARKNRSPKLQKLDIPYDATMKKYYRKIRKTKCQLAMYPSQIYIH